MTFALHNKLLCHHKYYHWYNQLVVMLLAELQECCTSVDLTIDSFMISMFQLFLCIFVIRLPGCIRNSFVNNKSTDNSNQCMIRLNIKLVVGNQHFVFMEARNDELVMVVSGYCFKSLQEKLVNIMCVQIDMLVGG